MEILYPEGLDFAEKYNANCYKDLDKDTKNYLNSLWNKLIISTSAPVENEQSGCKASIGIGGIGVVVISATCAAIMFKRKKRKN
jgi:hypothetical protein